MIGGIPSILGFSAGGANYIYLDFWQGMGFQFS